MQQRVFWSAGCSNLLRLSVTVAVCTGRSGLSLDGRQKTVGLRQSDLCDSESGERNNSLGEHVDRGRKGRVRVGWDWLGS